MQLDINLITQEEKKEQVTKKIIRGSTIFSIFLLLIVAGVSLYYYSRAQGLRSSIKEEDQKITQLRSQIRERESIEITARNLYQKYSVIRSIFEERVYNSYLLEHFASKVPSGVQVGSFNFRGDDEINISGDAPGYVSVSEFLRNLTVNEERQVFTSARLNSVTLNPADGSVRYSIVIGYNKEALKIYE